MGQNISRSCSNVTITVTAEEGHDESLLLQILPNGRGAQKTVAVTGANGFIGSQIVKLLLAKNYKVRGTVKEVDPAGVRFLHDLPRADGNLSLFYGKKLLDLGCYDDVFVGCDCVFHVASPTLLDQREMKEPGNAMIRMAVDGTQNVLTSVQKAGVNFVVFTSSMCAVIPPKYQVQKLVNEDHSACHKHLMDKGAWYALSKGLAEELAVKVSKDSAFRLARICPAFTVGPMLQPTVNSSMVRFAAICNGTHHTRTPNRSVSFVDVRDTAAHHVAAYEKGLEGRYMSVIEGWHWTLVYGALKTLNPKMNSPEPLHSVIKHRRVREYDTTRMDKLGVKQRSVIQVLRDAVREVDEKKIGGSPIGCYLTNSDIVLKAFEPYCGYYDLGNGDGRFLLINVYVNFSAGTPVVYDVNLSFLLSVDDPTATTLDVTADSNLTFNDGNLEWSDRNIYLSFTQGEIGESNFTVSGMLNGTQVHGICNGCAVPFTQAQGTFKDTNGAEVTIAISDENSKIIDYEGSVTQVFTYDTLKRLFFYPPDSPTSRLYLNVAAGGGLTVTFVGNGSTRYFSLNPNPTQAPQGAAIGFADLAKFGGYYMLNTTGSFVSILVNKTAATVGVCLDDTTSTEYTSYTFQNNQLFFPNVNGGPVLNFKQLYTTVNGAKSSVTVVASILQGFNYYMSVPLTAFGTRILSNRAGDVSLQIEDGGTKLVYTVGDTIVESTSFDYNPLEQVATFDNLSFNLTYNGGNEGVTCFVGTIPPSSDVNLLFAIPS